MDNKPSTVNSLVEENRMANFTVVASLFLTAVLALATTVRHPPRRTQSTWASPQGFMCLFSARAKA
jgi:hypothetical protein